MSELNLNNDQPVQDEFMMELQKEFLGEALFLLEACEESYLKLDNPSVRAEELDKIFRAAHSFKGTGASVGLTDLAGFAHIAEDCLSVLRVNPNLLNPSVISLLLKVGDAFKERVLQLQKGEKETWKIDELKAEVIQTTEALRAGVQSRPNHTPSEEVGTPQSPSSVQVSTQGPSSTIKVDAERIESVLNMIGELVVTKSQLTQSYKSMDTRNSQHESVMALLDKSIKELQDRAMSMRLTSMKPLFLKIQRAVRDVSLKLSKSIEFKMTGEDVEIDRTMIDLLGDPLVHIARNAVDHGIEKAEVRASKNKNQTALIELSAKQSGGRILIEVRDDGGGIDREKVIRKAIENGILPPGTQSSSITDQDAYKLLFAPGFSTAEQISDISGRGVGLDVVRSNIEKIKGTVEIETKIGFGSVFRISIPLTASITDGLLVSIGSERYIVPLDMVKELIRVNPADLTQINPDEKLINVRGKLFLLVETERVLSQVSGTQIIESSANRALVIDTGKQEAAFRLNEVLGQVQVVVKPMPGFSIERKYVSGTAILGDGRVALVLNVEEFLKSHQNQQDSLNSSQINQRSAA